MMDAKERAEKIMAWDVPAGVPYNLPETMEAKRLFITSEIEAAEREAIKLISIGRGKSMGRSEEWKLRAYAEGFKAAKARIMGILESHDMCPEPICIDIEGTRNRIERMNP